jgi:hypothetical protein
VIVKQSYPGHWKTRALMAALGGEAALYPLRLWGYCEDKNSEMLPDVPGILKLICNFEGKEAKLRGILVKCGFVDAIEGHLRVHQWEEHNSKMVASKNNGKRGGRPILPKPEDSVSPNPASNPTDNLTADWVTVMEGWREGGMKGDPPKPPKGLEGVAVWVLAFYAGLRRTGKFPSLSVEGLVQYVAGWPAAEREWPKVLQAARDHTGAIGSPHRWIPAQFGNLDLEKKKTAVAAGGVEEFKPTPRLRMVHPQIVVRKKRGTDGTGVSE